jgi:hypothetical protein
MKSLFSRIAMALLITSLASVSVFSKTAKQSITFRTDTKVNGTLVSKGVYDLKFDDKSGELSIVKDSKVIARATAGVEKRDHRSRQFVARFAGTGADLQLIGVTFEGADQDVVISGSQASR